jgi:hypothetical protein
MPCNSQRMQKKWQDKIDQKIKLSFRDLSAYVLVYLSENRRKC